MRSAADPKEELLTETHRIIIEQMQAAAAQGDMARFDSLMDRLVPGERSIADAEAAQAIEREARMDRWRIGVAAALIAGLVAIIMYAILRGNDVAGPYVSLVSGLAGIAIGWLYGSSGQHVTAQQAVPE